MATSMIDAIASQQIPEEEANSFSEFGPRVPGEGAELCFSDRFHESRKRVWGDRPFWLEPKIGWYGNVINAKLNTTYRAYLGDHSADEDEILATMRNEVLKNDPNNEKGTFGSRNIYTNSDKVTELLTNEFNLYSRPLTEIIDKGWKMVYLFDDSLTVQHGEMISEEELIYRVPRWGGDVMHILKENQTGYLFGRYNLKWVYKSNVRAFKFKKIPTGNEFDWEWASCFITGNRIDIWGHYNMLTLLAPFATKKTLQTTLSKELQQNIEFPSKITSYEELCYHLARLVLKQRRESNRWQERFDNAMDMLLCNKCNTEKDFEYYHCKNYLSARDWSPVCDECQRFDSCFQTHDLLDEM